MKILYICHRFPYPPKRGGKIRPFNMIKHLTAQGHDVTVASLVRSTFEAREGEGLRQHCARLIMEQISKSAALVRMLARLPTQMPSSTGYFYSPRLQRRIEAALADTAFDLIFVHCSSVAQYVADVKHIPKMLDFGDMDSQKWLLYSKQRRFPLSIGYLIEGLKLQRYEKKMAGLFDYCTCTTKAELLTLDSYQTEARTGWFPNGVDTDYFAPVAAAYDPDQICFIGRMDYYPNQQAMLHFCGAILPALRERRPQIKLVIVGAEPPPAIRKLGDRPGVTVTGSVPDVRPFVTASALTVAPLFIARGTQNKILESMAMGVPVVAGDHAAAGVDAVPGEHLLTGSTSDEFVAAILQLVENSQERARFSRAARQRVMSHHNWAHSMSSLDALIGKCMTNSNAKGGQVSVCQRAH
ncbi:MAG: TIGR03087 family PEP-CTERM/XrtA system glycosyltransferase [Gammaproteobacteria bacterium]